jgi:hypothetical protein
MMIHPFFPCEKELGLRLNFFYFSTRDFFGPRFAAAAKFGISVTPTKVTAPTDKRGVKLPRMVNYSNTMTQRLFGATH